MLKIIKNQKEKSFVEKIQSQHPYYEIWRLSKEDKNVIFVNEDRSEKNIDYVTTYFMNKKNPRVKINYYLTELKLAINYFFYPKKIPSYSFYQLILNYDSLKKDYFIISDYEFEDYWKKKIEERRCCLFEKTEADIQLEKKFFSLYDRIKRLEISKKQYTSLLRHPEKPYYIYQVVK
jgi:hypothetical protein